MGIFGDEIAQYGAWRRSLGESVRRYLRFLQDAELADAGVHARVDRILERLGQDKTSIAFVAEFSRGKSELINAIFFSDHRQRIVPSSAGRTTMCPTELRFDADRAVSIALLPVETRLTDTPLGEWRTQPEAWREIPIVADDADSLRRAFAAVQDTIRVPLEKAVLLGFGDDEAGGAGALSADERGDVEVPRWRHAIVNYPHPLLEMGLVIIDTPGLNAIGAEPELTLSMIPNADAVLFVLAADAGVTRSDVEVWRKHVAPSHHGGRIVVLNKIDGLWDELKDPAQIEAEIARQVRQVAETLELPEGRVFPVSAQKGLVARVNDDHDLLARSRIVELEQAISADLLPRRRELMREHVQREFAALAATGSGVLAARRRSAVEQLFELNGLRGKNRDVMGRMATRIRGERDEFEQSLRQLQGLRAVFARHSQSIYTTIGSDSLRRHVRLSREAMRASNFSTGLRTGMDSLVGSVRADFAEANRLCGEIGTLMSAMYKTFSSQHGLALGAPLLFSMKRYVDELDRIEALQRRQFGALTLVTTEKWALMRRYFESVAIRIKAVYESANRDVQAWLRAVMAPIEGQVREHQAQLKRRLDSVRRVIDANDSLDDRIGELERDRALIDQRVAIAEELAGQVQAVLGAPAHVETLEPA